MKAKPIPTSPKNRPADVPDNGVEAFMRDQEHITKPTVVRFSTSFFTIMTLVSLLAGIVGTVFILYGREQWSWLAQWTRVDVQSDPVVRTVTRKVESPTIAGTTISTVAQNVVGIYVRRAAVANTAPLLDQLYVPADRRGAGMLLTEDGVGVTTRRAIPDITKEIAVVTHDQSVFLTKQFYVDPASDLVYFQISARGLPVVDYAQVEGLALGEAVFAVGRQSTSLAPVVNTTTLATTLQQRVNSRADLLRSSERLTDLLQVHASSDIPGVPVFTTDGKLLGLHTGTDGDVIPVTTVQTGAQRIQKTGGVTRNILGVRFVDLSMAKGLLIKPAAEGSVGALLAGDATNVAVKTKSPADRAGLRAGDVVIKVNEQILNTAYTLADAIQAIEPRGVATLTFLREGKEQSVPVNLEVTSP